MADAGLAKEPASQATQTGDVAPIPSAFDRCVRCGYTLTGLPEPTVCPECGSACDRGQAVLVCNGFHSASIFSVYDRLLVLFGPSMAAMAVIRDWRITWQTLLWLFVGVIVVVQLVKIWRNPSLNRWVVILTRAGITQTSVADLGKSQPIPWSDVRQFSVRRGWLGGIVLRVRQKGWARVSVKLDLPEKHIAELRLLISTLFVKHAKLWKPPGT